MQDPEILLPATRPAKFSLLPGAAWRHCGLVAPLGDLTARYLAAGAAVRAVPGPAAFHARLTAAGQPKQVVRIAVAHTLPRRLTAPTRAQLPWQREQA